MAPATADVREVAETFIMSIWPVPLYAVSMESFLNKALSLACCISIVQDFTSRIKQYCFFFNNMKIS
jgi:hypothetical protein